MSLLTHVAQAYDDFTTTGGEEILVDPTATDAAANAGLIMLPVFFFILIVSYVLFAWLTAQLFKKAGLEAWKGWVPVYNIWLTFKLGNQPGWWAIVSLIPLANLIAAIIFLVAQYRIGLKFGKPGAFVLLAIFLPLVWYAWLAFDDSQWQDGTPAATPDTTPPSTPSPIV